MTNETHDTYAEAMNERFTLVRHWIAVDIPVADTENSNVLDDLPEAVCAVLRETYELPYYDVSGPWASPADAPPVAEGGPEA